MGATTREPEPRVVLLCQGCRYGWEPHDAAWNEDYLRALSNGCPECGDWLYLGQLTIPAPRPGGGKRR
jgi:hypothetical protein